MIIATWFLICDLLVLTIFFPVHTTSKFLNLKRIFAAMIMYTIFLCILNKKDMMKCYRTLIQKFIIFVTATGVEPTIT